LARQTSAQAPHTPLAPRSRISASIGSARKAMQQTRSTGVARLPSLGGCSARAGSVLFSTLPKEYVAESGDTGRPGKFVQVQARFCPAAGLNLHGDPEFPSPFPERTSTLVSVATAMSCLLRWRRSAVMARLATTNARGYHALQARTRSPRTDTLDSLHLRTNTSKRTG
jgi:hypothetical protein